MEAEWTTTHKTTLKRQAFESLVKVIVIFLTYSCVQELTAQPGQEGPPQSLLIDSLALKGIAKAIGKTKRIHFDIF